MKNSFCKHLNLHRRANVRTLYTCIYNAHHCAFILLSIHCKVSIPRIVVMCKPITQHTNIMAGAILGQYRPSIISTMTYYMLQLGIDPENYFLYGTF